MASGYHGLPLHIPTGAIMSVLVQCVVQKPTRRGTLGFMRVGTQSEQWLVRHTAKDLIAKGYKVAPCVKRRDNGTYLPSRSAPKQAVVFISDSPVDDVEYCGWYVPIRFVDSRPVPPTIWP